MRARVGGMQLLASCTARDCPTVISMSRSSRHSAPNPCHRRVQLLQGICGQDLRPEKDISALRRTYQQGRRSPNDIAGRFPPF
jgi:hypothetical protein